MSWLIIGGTGQLGRTLKNRLAMHGILDVYTPTSNTLDITSLDALDKYVKNIGPSIVVNCAAFTNVDSVEESPELANSINAIGARNIGQVGREVGALVYQISTDYVFSGKSHSPWKEEEKKEPVNVYGSSKSHGEDFLMSEYPSGARIFRTAGLYSCYGENIAKFFIKKALFSEGTVHCVVNQISQPTSAIDLSEQLILSYRANLPAGIYHATNAGSANWYEFALKIFGFVGAQTRRLVPVQDSYFSRKAQRPAYTVLSHENWTRQGIAPMRRWDLGLSETLPKIVHAVRKGA